MASIIISNELEDAPLAKGDEFDNRVAETIQIPDLGLSQADFMKMATNGSSEEDDEPESEHSDSDEKQKKNGMMESLINI
jgi:hypothetical protein